MIIWAIIPVKPLRDSKSRLAHILSPDERAALTEKMLSHTLETLNEADDIYRTLVVSRDPAVLKIARKYDAYTFGEGDRQELNLAVTRAAHIAAAQKADGVLILPADLPFLTVEDIEMVINGIKPYGRGQSANGYYYQSRAVAVCPDQNNDGTNALLVVPPTGFNFHYGPDSFSAHLDEANRLGMSRRIIHAPGLKFDLDTEKDYQTYLTYQAVHAG